MPDHQPISDQVGTRLLFENESVRVWDFRLAPGESTKLHRHTTDYLYVVIGGGSLATIDAAGNQRPPEQMADGEVRFRRVHGETVHQAVNVGDTEWRNIVLELKRPEVEPPTAKRPTKAQEDFGEIPGGPGTHG